MYILEKEYNINGKNQHCFQMYKVHNNYYNVSVKIVFLQILILIINRNYKYYYQTVHQIDKTNNFEVHFFF